MAFKIALTAGHYKYTSGKRCSKQFDPNETREWVLNDRIADKIEKLLAANYTGYELLRTDDTTGEVGKALSDITNMANDFGADFYLSIHHNAGINGGKGGGIVAYVYTNPTSVSVEWQKALYNALIEATGLKGNRATPLARGNLHEVREPKMPSVLLELGFMDSQVDTPIIITEDFANKCAEAIVKVLAERGNLKKKVNEEKAKVEYRVYLKVGAYATNDEADRVVANLKVAGLDACVVSAKNETAAEKEEPNVEKPVEVVFNVGDAVKVEQGATVYGKETKFSNWVFSTKMYVREVSGDRIVISTTKEGAITGAIHKKYLTKV